MKTLFPGSRSCSCGSMRTAPADPAAAAAYVQLRLILYMVEDDQERTKAHSLTVVSAGHESTRPCYHQLLLPVNLLRHSWGSLPPRSDVIECNYRAHRQTHGHRHYTGTHRLPRPRELQLYNSSPLPFLTVTGCVYIQYSGAGGGEGDIPPFSLSLPISPSVCV